MKRQEPADKKKLLRVMDHLTRPPRLKNAVHKRGVKPVRKKKLLHKKEEQKK
ncbi:hypothetical protein HYS79_02255 [Patescibacteria group bacterium]|nr:hypothetical protein [Patescibacteria group bacterium]